MIIDHGVQKRGADERAVFTASLSGLLRLRARVDLALLTGEELVPSAIGDVAELGHVDVDHRPG